jgi:hypothetical protein
MVLVVHSNTNYLNEENIHSYVDRHHYLSEDIKFASTRGNPKSGRDYKSNPVIGH